eukprot:scaffold40081_cov32-Tisochrysis_lutea.AAC.1
MSCLRTTTRTLIGEGGKASIPKLEGNSLLWFTIGSPSRRRPAAGCQTKTEDHEVAQSLTTGYGGAEGTSRNG